MLVHKRGASSNIANFFLLVTAAKQCSVEYT
jgi:hypothetical protein